VMDLHKAAPHMQISLDGNQGCTYESARTIVRSLAQQGVRPIFFEQPLPEDDWQGMTKLTAEGEIKICADELVKTPADARRVVDEKAAHVINLKFVKSGLRNAIEIARIAIASKLELMIGGMLESEIMMTASLHAASVISEIRYVDLDTPFFFEKRLTKESPYHANSAWLNVPNSHGLGLTLSL
jgi:L-alanine-DL-glutamate epimerase-like enolase superfamily enzyme